MIEMVALDMAGTTVADDGVVLAAFTDAIDTAPDVDRDEAMGFVEATMGRSKIEVFTELLGDARRAAEVNNAFERSYERRVRDGEVRPIDGAPEAMAQMRAAGLKVCLTTGFSPYTRRGLIEALGWTGSVDLALSPADAGRGRPFPDMILTAMVSLRIDDVRHCAVAGDTVSDVIAGHRSGASVVAGVLTGAHDREQLASAPATHILASVTDLVPLVTQTGSS